MKMADIIGSCSQQYYIATIFNNYVVNKTGNVCGALVQE